MKNLILNYQVSTTQLVNMSIDPKFVELTADVLIVFQYNIVIFFSIASGLHRHFGSTSAALITQTELRHGKRS